MMHVEDIMSTLGDFQFIGVFNIKQRLYQLASLHESWHPPDVLNIPRCTEHTLYKVTNV